MPVGSCARRAAAALVAATLAFLAALIVGPITGQNSSQRVTVATVSGTSTVPGKTMIEGIAVDATDEFVAENFAAVVPAAIILAILTVWARPVISRGRQSLQLQLTHEGRAPPIW